MTIRWKDPLPMPDRPPKRRRVLARTLGRLLDMMGGKRDEAVEGERYLRAKEKRDDEVKVEVKVLEEQDTSESEVVEGEGDDGRRPVDEEKKEKVERLDREGCIAEPEPVKQAADPVENVEVADSDSSACDDTTGTSAIASREPGEKPVYEDRAVATVEKMVKDEKEDEVEEEEKEEEKDEVENEEKEVEHEVEEEVKVDEWRVDEEEEVELLDQEGHASDPDPNPDTDHIVTQAVDVVEHVEHVEEVIVMERGDSGPSTCVDTGASATLSQGPSEKPVDEDSVAPVENEMDDRMEDVRELVEEYGYLVDLL